MKRQSLFPFVTWMAMFILVPLVYSSQTYEGALVPKLIAFQFLGVTTLRELEALRADDIIERLTRPAVETVQRIRKSLALLNRNLAGDRKFALKFRADLKRGK